MNELLKQVRHELASLNGLYVTDKSAIALNCDLKEIIWQLNEKELIAKIDKQLMKD